MQLSNLFPSGLHRSCFIVSNHSVTIHSMWPLQCAMLWNGWTVMIMMVWLCIKLISLCGKKVVFMIKSRSIFKAKSVIMSYTNKFDVCQAYLAQKISMDVALNVLQNEFKCNTIQGVNLLID